MGFVYIGADDTKPNHWKIGMTKRNATDRISETTNPDYYLKKAFKTNEPELIESNVHKELDKYRKKHRATQRDSEWFVCDYKIVHECVIRHIEKRKPVEVKKEVKTDPEVIKKRLNAESKATSDGSEEALKRYYEMQEKSRLKRIELESESTKETVIDKILRVFKK